MRCSGAPLLALCPPQRSRESWIVRGVDAGEGLVVMETRWRKV